MARAPDQKEIEAKELYKKGMKLIEISNTLAIPEGTIRRWKSTHKWDSERSDKKSERSEKKPHGGQKGNKNAKGNKGGRSLPKNKKAEKHGFYSKWLPEETASIIGTIVSTDPLDLLWSNIMLQSAAIYRAQSIMFVKDKDEIIKEPIRTKVKEKVRTTDKTTTTDSEIETEYAFQFAWDRQATFLNAQSKAMKTLEGMLRQYEELLHKNWDLTTEEQRARIELLRKQTGINTGDTSESGIMMMPEVIEGDVDG